MLTSQSQLCRCRPCLRPLRRFKHVKSARGQVSSHSKTIVPAPASEWATRPFSIGLAGAVMSSAWITWAAAAAGAPTILSGAARVVDGDTLYVADQKVRLFGVDAPEKLQLCKDGKGGLYKCGQESAEALKQKVGQKEVSCAVKTKDQYGRNVATCSLAKEDIGSWLVQNGHAVAYRQFTKDYIPAEEAAKASHTGIWQGDFQMPNEWRKQQRAPASPDAAAIGSASGPLTATLTDTDLLSVVLGLVAGQPAPDVKCLGLPIKGNINSKGEKIYHLPGGAQYARVDIDLSEGERYFCTEAEALNAGWRASLR